VFEIYGGYGISGQKHNYTSIDYSSGTFYTVNSGYSDLKSGKLFLQPSIGFSFDIFDVALSTRFCRLSFNEVNNHINGQVDQYDYEELYNVAQNKIYYFLEPAFTLRVGWKNIKVQFQAAIDSYFNNPDIPFEGYHFGLGLQYVFAERFKKDIK
jgi:hypothetical protein